MNLGCFDHYKNRTVYRTISHTQGRMSSLNMSLMAGGNKYNF